MVPKKYKKWTDEGEEALTHLKEAPVKIEDTELGRAKERKLKQVIETLAEYGVSEELRASVSKEASQGSEESEEESQES